MTVNTNIFTSLYTITIVAIICNISSTTWAFAPSYYYTNTNLILSTTTTSLYATSKHSSSSTANKNKSTNKKKKPQYKTIADMMKALEKNPNEFVTNGASSTRQVNANGKFIDTKKKKKPKRSRKRVDRPKQTYIYASQRRALEELDGGSKNGKKMMKNNNGDGVAVEQDGEYNEINIDHQKNKLGQQQLQNQQQQQQQQQRQAQFVRTLGLNPSNQVADPIIGNSNEDVPRIIGAIRVDGLSSSSSSDDGDDNVGTTATTITSNSFAYVLYKPVGWSILGEKKKKNKNKKTSADIKADEPTVSTTSDTFDSISSTDNKTRNKSKRVKAYDEQLDDFTYVEYNEADVLSVLTPEERAELLKEGGLSLNDDFAEIAKDVLAGSEWDDDDDDDGDGLVKNKKRKGKKKDQNTSAGEVVPRSRTRANLNNPTRPSLVSWLKELKSNEGTPIKGGKNWIALSGATEIDDSGLVLLCPRDQIQSMHVDKCEYIAVLGNGKKLVSRSKLLKSKSSLSTGTGGSSEAYDDSTVQIDILSRIKRGRDSDPILSVSVNFPDGSLSTCSHAVLLCQNKFGDGVRGDAMADPLDRRASRRLVHCTSMTVTSLANLDDDPVVVEGCHVPDDIANYVNRRDGTMFTKGSFLGRQCGLAQNGLTNAYREVNGATDGHPGWIVDRYDKHLFVQQEEGSMSAALGRGPLPSLHDGYTSGVYYLPTKADRSVMGSEKIKPTLLEGKAAPDFIPIMENGITYLVNMGESYSTGIFLDQRLQRAWLSEVCNEDTRLLNCFAHTGAFSVAAATAGAKTVSLDLDKKWLDRIHPQMEANGITEWEGHHDCIYGDCFDWLARLAKRGEQFDIVILDPPSTSVGKKKKRWSAKSDMAELVALAAPLVKTDGLLFTTTNSASIRVDKFANMCKKGLDDAGISGKLERVAPMPSDFLSIGPQPVKNLVWRIQ